MLAAGPGPALPASPPPLRGRGPGQVGPEGPAWRRSAGQRRRRSGRRWWRRGGSGSEPPTPRGGRQGRTLPRGLRGTGRPPGGAAAWLTAAAADRLAVLIRVGLTQPGHRGRGGGFAHGGPGRWLPGYWTHPSDCPVSSSRTCQERGVLAAESAHKQRFNPTWDIS